MVRRVRAGAAAGFLLATVLSARVSAQAVPKLYGVGDIGVAKLASETGFTISMGSAGIWSRLMGAARVDGVFVPSSRQSRCHDSAMWPFASNRLCDPRVARVGVMIDVDLVISANSHLVFIGGGYRTGGVGSTVIGSAGVFLDGLDRRGNGYVRLTGGKNFIELSIGAFLSGGT